MVKSFQCHLCFCSKSHPANLACQLATFQHSVDSFHHLCSFLKSWWLNTKLFWNENRSKCRKNLKGAWPRCSVDYVRVLHEPGSDVYLLYKLLFAKKLTSHHLHMLNVQSHSATCWKGGKFKEFCFHIPWSQTLWAHQQEWYVIWNTSGHIRIYSGQ